MQNSHKKTFVRWIAKNRDFLQKNQFFPKMKGLIFIKTVFKLRKQCHLKYLANV